MGKFFLGLLAGAIMVSYGQSRIDERKAKEAAEAAAKAK